MCRPQRSFLMKRHLKLGRSCPGPWGPRPWGQAMGPRGHGIPSAMKLALMPRWRRPLKRLTHPYRHWCLSSRAATMKLSVLSVRITTDPCSGDGIWPQSDGWMVMLAEPNHLRGAGTHISLWKIWFMRCSGGMGERTCHSMFACRVMECHVIS